MTTRLASLAVAYSSNPRSSNLSLNAKMDVILQLSDTSKAFVIKLLIPIIVDLQLPDPLG